MVSFREGISLYLYIYMYAQTRSQIKTQLVHLHPQQQFSYKKIHRCFDPGWVSLFFMPGIKQWSSGALYATVDGINPYKSLRCFFKPMVNGGTFTTGRPLNWCERWDFGVIINHI